MAVMMHVADGASNLSAGQDTALLGGHIDIEIVKYILDLEIVEETRASVVSSYVGIRDFDSISSNQSGSKSD